MATIWAKMTRKNNNIERTPRGKSLSNMRSRLSISSILGALRGSSRATDGLNTPLTHAATCEEAQNYPVFDPSNPEHASVDGSQKTSYESTSIRKRLSRSLSRSPQRSSSPDKPGSRIESFIDSMRAKGASLSQENPTTGAKSVRFFVDRPPSLKLEGPVPLLPALDLSTMPLLDDHFLGRRQVALPVLLPKITVEQPPFVARNVIADRGRRPLSLPTAVPGRIEPLEDPFDDSKALPLSLPEASIDKEGSEDIGYRADEESSVELNPSNHEEPSTVPQSDNSTVVKDMKTMDRATGLHNGGLLKQQPDGCPTLQSLASNTDLGDAGVGVRFASDAYHAGWKKSGPRRKWLSVHAPRTARYGPYDAMHMLPPP